MSRRALLAVLLLGFAGAVGLRVAVGGPAVAQSRSAGVVFALVLLAFATAARTAVPVTWRALGVGLLGVLLVCAPVGLAHLVSVRPLHDTRGFGGWALAVVLVATAEEVFLRGTLYDATLEVAGTAAAVLLPAVCFALLHVPLYGWHVLPLDLAVGVVLGGLRHQTGTAAAPAVTHVGADLVGWFLR